VRPISILNPVAYTFLMLRRIFGEKLWRLALKTVVLILSFVLIEVATAVAIVAAVTWANGHWA
jgi:hypothetical protein